MSDDKVVKDDKKKETTIKVIVHRMNIDPENKDLPITVNVVGGAGRKVFAPGKEIKLAQSQIDVLKNAVEEHQLAIPGESGIYEAQNPKKAAEAQYPGFTVNLDPETGLITMIKRTPNYVVEYM